MTTDDQQAILTIALFASFADGRKDEREREELREIADALAQAGEPNMPALYRQVLLRQVKVEDATARLSSPELRQLAYEMAVGVCDADGARSDAERSFLSTLANSLGIEAGSAERLAEEADTIAEAPVARPLPTALDGDPSEPAGPMGGSGTAATGAGPATPPASQRPSSMSEAEMDRTIMNAAILNGALELLPDSLATMAIIPLQLRLVYRIGHSYGYELDQGHTREFLAAAGVGLGGQYLEQAARRLLGGVLRKVGGKAIGGLGRQATSSAMSFATTWALGQVARRYYAGGRTLDAASLKQSFEGMLGDARDMQARMLPQIEARSRTLDLQQVMQSLRN